MQFDMTPEMLHDALTVAIEEHSLSVERLLKEAFPDNPDVIRIYKEQVYPNWATFVEVLIGRATSQSASASVMFQQHNEDRMDGHDRRLNEHEYRIAKLEAGDDALADSR